MKMKTEVLFESLPYQVQTFLNRILDPSGVTMYVPHFVNLHWLNNLKEWKDATNEERLVYAEWRYKKATKFIPVKPNVFGDKVSTVDVISSFTEGIASNKNWLYYENKWAEIIEEPEKIDWSKANKDNIPVEEEPELDKNEEKPLHPIWDKCSIENHINEMVKQSEKEEQELPSHVLQFRLEELENRVEYLMNQIESIRKPDPDQHLKEIAKEIIENCSYRVSYSESIVENLLIQMGKKVEALKKGKEL